MNTSTQDTLVTMTTIIDIAKAFRFDDAKKATQGEPQFTCDLFINNDKSATPVTEYYEFRFTERFDLAGFGCFVNFHMVLRTEPGMYGNRYYLSIYDSPKNEASHQFITDEAAKVIIALMKDMDMEVSLSWIGR